MAQSYKYDSMVVSKIDILDIAVFQQIVIDIHICIYVYHIICYSKYIVKA